MSLCFFVFFFPMNTCKNSALKDCNSSAHKIWQFQMKNYFNYDYQEFNYNLRLRIFHSIIKVLFHSGRFKICLGVVFCFVFRQIIKIFLNRLQNQQRYCIYERNAKPHLLVLHFLYLIYFLHPPLLQALQVQESGKPQNAIKYHEEKLFE